MVVALSTNGLSAVLQPTLALLFYVTMEYMGNILSIWFRGDRVLDRAYSSHFLRSGGEPKTYDFIVVGAGSAGAVVANRLSRNLYSVLLLETGGEPMPLQYVPQTWSSMINHPETDWMHRTVPQKRASLNSINAKSSWSAGKVLGGTCTINNMVHLRGHRRDYDNWANLTGDPEWSWEGVLPYYKKHEDYEVPGDPINHGYGGDLRMESTDFVGVAPEFVRAGVELGYPHLDVNAPFEGAGFDYVRYPMRRGRRIATYLGFLEPIKNSPLLTIMKYSHVNRVLFGSNNTAYGVQFDRHGKRMTALASKEVILSAGALGSPKILILSGVAPKEHLKNLGIPLISDLPVGQNLQDHLAVFLAPFFINQPRAVNFKRDFTTTAILQWLTQGKGPLSNAGPTATGLFPSKFAIARGEANWPDMHLIASAYTMFPSAVKSFAHVFSQNADELTKYYEHSYGKDAAQILVLGARPLSRGYLKLGGSSPYDRLIIEPNYLGDEEDLDFKVLLEAVKKTLYLMENTTSMGVELGARFTTKKLPGCEHLEFRSDSYWECYIRRNSITMHHPTGTVAMGSVVDTRLRVKGVTGLRVIDNSIQPVLISTNTQAPAIMIGEKGADMILRDWNTQVKN